MFIVMSVAWPSAEAGFVVETPGIVETIQVEEADFGFGQRFTIAEDATLDRFSIYARSTATGDEAAPLRLMLRIGEWGSLLDPIAPVMFTSPVVDVAAGPNLQAVTFTPGIALEAGKTYVAAVLHADYDPLIATTAYRGELGVVRVDSFEPIKFLPDDIFDQARLRTSTFKGSELAFRAEFLTHAVPEPASLSLVGIGLVGLTGAALRRRRYQKPI